MHSITSADRQIAKEDANFKMGQTEYLRRVADLKARKHESHTDYGQSLLMRTVHPLTEAIQQFMDEASSRPGRRHVALRYLSLVRPEVAAIMTVRHVVNSMGAADTPLTSLANRIATQLETEVQAEHIEQSVPELYAKVMRNLSAHPMGYQPKVRVSTMRHVATKFNLVTEKWKLSDKVHLGTKLIELLIESTGMVYLLLDNTYRKRRMLVVPTPEMAEWVRTHTERQALTSPFLMPMIAPPRPWTTMKDGGYYTESHRFPLLKNWHHHTNRRGYMDELMRSPPVKMLEAVNVLQATPWKINSKVFDFVKQAWEAGLVASDMPPLHDEPLPTKPADYESNVEARKQWKDEAADVFRRNLAHRSKRIQVQMILDMATWHAGEEAIYFPVQCDFRGRIYCVPKHLNPQGCDLAKSLLTFAEGKPLDGRGAFWLAVHTANVAGHDKLPLEQRAQWTIENSDAIVEMAADPLSHRWWTEVDKPFQFLAAAFEWAGYINDENHLCSLPIMVDGTCNGLQHFAAMLRDEVAGREVNLLPAEKPADIYKSVADAVTAVLEKDDNPFAKQWLEVGITRSLCKRPVMVLPYGGTRNAVVKYVREETRPGNPFGRQFGKASAYLASVIWNVMDEVITGPRRAMDWLREVSRIVSAGSSKGLPICWTTPAGFPVMQAYQRSKIVRVKTKIGEQFVFLNLAEQLKEPRLDRQKQKQAIAPNFVHSLDAAALMLTIRVAHADGIRDLVAIHDSYGTHAADMDRLQQHLRNCFVEMYQGDVLARFAEEVGQIVDKPLPALPEKGKLDLGLVKQSKFFFS